MHQQTTEDYLKTIYLLAETQTPVSTSRIAQARQIQSASVTNMMQRLAKVNLVKYRKHNGVTLTSAGEKVALEQIRHHRLLELFLVEKLGFSWDEVHEQAELLEHAISEQFEDRIAAILGHPKFNPHGEPIPSKDGVMAVMDTQPLTLLSQGSYAIVSHIADDSNPELLCYLAELGIRPGVSIHVVDVDSFAGSITIEVNNNRKMIGYQVAKIIHLKK